MRIIHQGPRASSPDSQAEYTQAIRPRFCLLLENALQFGGSPYTGLGKPQLRQRSERISPTCVRDDAQLEHSDRRELDVMVFRLGSCASGAEIPLLPHDFPERLPAIRRPTQDVLLRALGEGVHEVQPDPPEPLRMGE